MLDLRYEWHPNPSTPIDHLFKEALEMGTISAAQKWHDGWEVVLELGAWEDINIRCVGRGPTNRDALALALAKAKWIASRLTDEPEIDNQQETE